MEHCWNSELRYKFIKKFKDEPILWDPDHPDYKSKQDSHDAWQRISDAIDMPISELKRQKENMFHIYRRCRRIVNHKPYFKPSWFAYNFMDSFLGDILGAYLTSFNTKTQNTDGKNSQRNISHRRHKLKSTTFSEETVDCIEGACEDGFYHFGQFVASRLRPMKDKTSRKLMNDIYNLIYSAECSDEMEEIVDITDGEYSLDNLPEQFEKLSDDKVFLEDSLDSFSTTSEKNMLGSEAELNNESNPKSFDNLLKLDAPTLLLVPEESIPNGFKPSGSDSTNKLKTTPQYRLILAKPQSTPTKVEPYNNKINTKNKRNLKKAT